MTEPYELSVREAVAEIRKGALSPVELLESMLRRIEQTEPKIQAWVTIDAEGARAQARQIETKRDYAGLLPGIPFGFKDIFDVRGLPTGAGFGPWADNVAKEDAETVANLRSHGMVALGKTVTTQFALSDPPKSRNPWNLDRTPSGSSSGSGASVGARQVTAALGTQTTGSNLRPAAYNGIVGFKPSHGLLSRRGIVPLSWSMDHPGILARTVADAGLILDALARPRRPGVAEVPTPYLEAATSPRPPRLGLITDFQAVAIPEVRENVARVAERLGAAGAEVREVSLATDLETIKDAQFLLLQCEAAEIHRSLFARSKEHYLPRTRATIEIAQTLPAWAYVKAQRIRLKVRREIEEGLLGDLDCLLSPTAPDLPPPISAGTTGDYSLLAAWSFLGLPATSIPAGRARDGMPHAIQLAARRWRDATTLRAAAWCEGVLGTLGMPPL